MTTELMPRPVTTKPKPARQADPTVKEIIAAARQAPLRSPGAWLLSGATAVLMWASFPPLEWSPLAWVCLVPLIWLIRSTVRTRRMYTAIYCGGLAFTLSSLQWMRLGDTWMYPAWIALSLYMAAYFPVFVAVSRVAVHRFRLPLMLAVPGVWVGLEYLRTTLMTGFGWYQLGHTQYRWIELIQISDLVGAYGVSFVVALGAACLAGVVPLATLSRWKLLPEAAVRPGLGVRGQGSGEESRSEANAASTGQASESALRSAAPLNHQPSTFNPTRKQAVQVVVCLAVLGSVLGYGYFRRAQAEFREGPRVALIQGNFTTSLKHNPHSMGEIYQRHDFLTGQAVQHQPDLIVWPETMFRWPLYELSPEMTDEELLTAAPGLPESESDRWIGTWRDPMVRNVLAANSQKAGAAMVIGIDVLEAHPRNIQHFNSAVFVTPQDGLSGRYDKLHRVIFGEYIPLRDTFPWIAKLTPFGENFGIEAGASAAVFRYHDWTFAPIICFEDTVPHLVRRILRATAAENDGKSIDCLINLTNDGWFHGSSELDQHLITAAFRCVEYRTPMARAVNTGISAVIDGDGVIVEPDVLIDGDQFADGNHEARTTMRDPKTGRWHRQLDAALVHSVPLDDRTSLYLLWGDWFAGMCVFLIVIVVLMNLLPLKKPTHQPAIAEN
jgi:apolipoprotein N-acyltransferase